MGNGPSFSHIPHAILGIIECIPSYIWLHTGLEVQKEIKQQLSGGNALQQPHAITTLQSYYCMYVAAVYT